MLTTKRTTSVVGLDLEAGSVAATEIRGNGSVEVAKTGVVSMEPGAVREGEVTDPDALAETLRALFSEHGLAKTVRLGIANQRVAVRTMRLPEIDDADELESAVRFQAQEHIPMPLEHAVIDYQIVGHPTREDGSRELEVVAVAARRDMLDRLLEALHRAGVRPIGIDLSAFGMIRALAQESHDAGVPPTPSADPSAVPVDGSPAKLYCNLGDVTNLAVARGRTCLFTRISPFGVEGIAERLAERRGLTLEQARQWLGQVDRRTEDVDRPAEEVDADHATAEVDAAPPTEEADGDSDTAETARVVLAEGASKLANELRLSLEFYATQEDAVPVQGVVACGPGSTIPGLAGRLQRELAQPFEVVRPRTLEHLDPAVAARLTVAYGLALGE
jgi:type IV pilus assembly protein PilM